MQVGEKGIKNLKRIINFMSLPPENGDPGKKENERERLFTIVIVVVVAATTERFFLFVPSLLSFR